MFKRTLLASAILSTLSAPSAMAGNDIKSVEFTETPAPLTVAQQQQAYSESSAIVTYANGKKATFPLSYHVLYSTGDQVGNWKAGTIVDNKGYALQTAQIDEAGTTAQGPFYAHSPDANSLMKQGDNIFLVTHLEYDTEAPNIDPTKPMISMYGALPMVMNLASIRQDHKTGQLSAFSLKNVDMSGVNGLWIPCAGELTPWNTHIGGEEYEPDAKNFQTKPLTPMNLFKNTAGQLPPQGANPYQYGMITEVSVSKQGKTNVTKHYAMGRMANELAHVMPDRKTAYKGDDGKDVVLTMFVADQANDLSRGTLYAAHMLQKDGGNGGQFGIEWIRLGHASDEKIAEIIASGIKYSDIFDDVSKADYLANPSAYDGYKPVLAYTGTGGSSGLRYLKLKPGMETAAAFLETRRYAAYLGATTEFTKMEGMTSSNAGKKLYVAMSYVQNSMLAGQNADHPADDISLTDDPKNLACGIVYQSSLVGGQFDTSGNRIHSQWVATDMGALLQGAQKPATQTAYGIYDKCDTDKMANPDNLKYSEGMRTLFIGEDSGNHLNNFLWAYSVDSGTLTRIASNRAGAEWTGLQAVDGMNGYAYIMSNIQHPGAEEDLSGYKSKIPQFDNFRNGIDQRGAVGYLGGMPAIKKGESEDGSHHQD